MRRFLSQALCSARHHYFEGEKPGLTDELGPEEKKHITDTAHNKLSEESNTDSFLWLPVSKQTSRKDLFVLVQGGDHSIWWEEVFRCETDAGSGVLALSVVMS